MTIATTILEQLGGQRFVAMTGAKHLLGSPDSLCFILPGTPGFVKHGITECRITLTPMDTYTVTYLRVRRSVTTVIATCEGIYADNLQSCFTRETGLQTHL